MVFLPENKPIDEFLQTTAQINHKDARIRFVAEWLMGRLMNQSSQPQPFQPQPAGFADPELELVRLTGEYVYARIVNTADTDHQLVTRRASEVLNQREGSGLSKPLLLAALLRANGIATGFCYQYVVESGRMTPDGQPRRQLRVLNAAYLESIGQWLRLDVRGLAAEQGQGFPLDQAALSQGLRPELGETDLLQICSDPHPVIIRALQTAATYDQLLAIWPQTVTE